MQTTATYYATEPARYIGGFNASKDEKRRAAAAKLAERTAHTGTMADFDTAAVIYNTAREQHPEDSVEWLIAAVFAAGIEKGREREKARRRRSQSREGAQRA